MKRFILSFPLFVVTAASAHAVAPFEAEAALTDCFAKQAQMASFSGIVAASRNGQLFRKSAGYSDAAGTVPITDQTRFRLASVQKVLTAVAIGQLVDRGKLSLDAPIGTYITGLPADIAAVTADQLLQHRSGVTPMHMINPQIANTFRAARNARDLLPLVTAAPLSFKPGERQEYSNGGYLLLGALIEAVSGKDYATYLAESIFAPLAMTSTDLNGGKAIAVRRSRMVPGAPMLAAARPIVGMPEPVGTSAGDGVSTAADMLKLGEALVSDRLLSRATKDRVFPHRIEPWRIGQSGGTFGTNTDFGVYPALGLTVVTLTNEDPPAGELMGEVMRKAAGTGTCLPLDPKDRPSPMRMILRAPPGSHS